MRYLNISQPISALKFRSEKDYFRSALENLLGTVPLNVCPFCYLPPPSLPSPNCHFSLKRTKNFYVCWNSHLSKVKKIDYKLVSLSVSTKKKIIIDFYSWNSNAGYKTIFAQLDSYTRCKNECDQSHQKLSFGTFCLRISFLQNCSSHKNVDKQIGDIKQYLFGQLSSQI